MAQQPNSNPILPRPSLHEMDTGEDDDFVKQLQECSAVYLALQDCLIEGNHNWKVCQKDDMVLFSEASLNQMNILIECLDQFCKASRQKVNRSKSNFYVSGNVNSEYAALLAQYSGLTLTKDIGRHQGVPLIHGRVTEDFFANVINRVKDRLGGWKTKYLSIAGRHVLAQSVLSTIPYYAMQTTLLPLSICDNVDKRIRQFIWGGTGEKKACHMVRWDIVTQPKDRVGLGIRSARDMNTCLGINEISNSKFQIFTLFGKQMEL